MWTLQNYTEKIECLLLNYKENSRNQILQLYYSIQKVFDETCTTNILFSSHFVQRSRCRRECTLGAKSNAEIASLLRVMYEKYFATRFQAMHWTWKDSIESLNASDKTWAHCREQVNDNNRKNIHQTSRI